MLRRHLRSALAAVGLVLALLGSGCSGGQPLTDESATAAPPPPRESASDPTPVAGPVEGTEDPKGPADLTLQASEGNVAFPHRQHQTDFACESCHHTLTDGARPEPCRTCHGVDAGIPDVKTAFHTWCVSCHEQQGGPTACEQCHAG